MLALLCCIAALAACKGANSIVPASSSGTSGMSAIAPPMPLTKPESVSPGSIMPAPMAQTSTLAASAMVSPQGRAKTMETISSTSWTQVPGSASEVVASPDGSLWVLSNEPSGSNKYVWHYVNGSWTNITGEASQLAVSPSGGLYALNSSGGVYSWNGSSWNALAGGASSLTVAADGSLYVISNGGSGAIWHYSNGTWTQLPGSGETVEANWDPNSYSTPGGTVSPNGFYVLNSSGYVYYGTSSGSYVAFTGQATALAPTIDGGFFALSYPANDSSGTPIWYYNLASPGWTEEGGAAIDISANDASLYVLSASDAIYESSISGSGRSAGPGSALDGPLYGGAVNGCGGDSDVVCDGYGPTDVAEKLDYPVQQGYDGTGETVAIVIDSTPASSDVSEYLSYNDTPSRSRTLSVENVEGGVSNSDDKIEATLDEETIAGLAPGANVKIYAVPSLTVSYIDDAYNAIISDGVAKVASSSFGACESGYASEDLIPAMDAILAEGAQEGIAFTASSGDTGNTCYYDSNDYPVGVSYPASDPNVTGVGGTETYPSNPDELTNPVVWNDDYCDSYCAGGGGVSAYFSVPQFQLGIASAMSSGCTACTGFSTSYRNVPDVSEPAEYVSIYEGGAWGLEAGTSWAAPEYAALMAEVYEYCGTSVANPVTLPYYVYSQSGYNAFIDVSSGNDDFAYGSSGSPTPAPGPYYDAGTGPDAASGIGVPLGSDFANAACPSNEPAAVVERPYIGTAAIEQHAAAAPTMVDVRPRVRGLIDEGERDSNATTPVQIVLRPTSTLASDEQSLVQTLQSAGFTVVRRFSNHLIVDAEAPSGTVESFFSTQMHNVSQGSYGMRYMPATTAVIPASIAASTAGIVLDDVVTMFAPKPIQLRPFVSKATVRGRP